MPEQPPQLLQIVREPLKAGAEAAFHALEEDVARTALALGCPHPYLGAESLTGPTEAWWFHGYKSQTKQQQVYDAYAANAPLLTALTRSVSAKAVLTFAPIDGLARYRPDLSGDRPWLLGHGRFLVITVTKNHGPFGGTVFEAPDRTCFIVTGARTRDEADAAQTLAGFEANIFAVRPSWSFPAKTWGAADLLFWQPKPPAARV